MAWPRKLLLIRLSSLGDVVLTTPVLTILRRNLPQTRIDYLTRTAYISLLESDPRIDRVIGWEPESGADAAQSLARLIGELRSERYDLVIDLHRVPRSILITAFSGAKNKIFYSKRRRDRVRFVRRHLLPDPPLHAVDMYLKALNGLGIGAERPKPELYLPASDRMENKNPDPEIATIGLVPGARWPTKRWPIGHFASLAIRIKRDLGCRVVVVLSPDETGLGDRMESLGDGSIDRIVYPELGDLPGALGTLDLAVVNDSGPMHVAGAVGTPVLALFGPTHPGLGFAPVGEKDRLLHLDLPCSPCSLHGKQPCRYPRRFCLDDLTPDRVADTLVDMMGGL